MSGLDRETDLMRISSTPDPRPSPREDAITPCGRCRQLLHEHGGPRLLVDGEGGPVPLGELLPGAFGPDDLGTRAGR